MHRRHGCRYFDLEIHDACLSPLCSRGRLCANEEDSNLILDTLQTERFYGVVLISFFKSMRSLPIYQLSTANTVFL
jgi:hypothetical protein